LNSLNPRVSLSSIDSIVKSQQKNTEIEPINRTGLQSHPISGFHLSFQLLLAVRRLHSTLLAAVIHEGAIAPIALSGGNEDG